ncbi:MAG TPA: HDOD domain-containing protein [Candidatus Acidoferrum sp.]|nr:HDOD domain-containing protein [Candidatus Acidoferrum sp.]
MKKRILFVTKDQALWNEFQSQASSGEGEWAGQHVRTGREALDLAQQFNFAVVVADAELADVSGLELLDQFLQRQPSAHRFVLSEVSDTEATVKCVGKPHHHLLRPLSARTLLNALEQAFAHEVWLPSRAVHGLIAQMRHVPSPPSTYFKVVEEIRSPRASLEKIGELIAEDPAITAKVLQLANSAVFGLQLQVNQPLEAIAYIGLETTKALVLLAHTVSSFNKVKLPGFSVEELWRHSLSAGQMAQRIALMEKGGLEAAELAFAGGLLHDIGKLLFCANLPELFAKTLALAREEKCMYWDAEAQLFPNAGHAELGGCLLGMWGLPQPIVEAVALHHYPRQLAGPDFHPLTAVHAADVLDHEMHPDRSVRVPTTFHAGYLAELGLAHRAEYWRRQCGAAKAAVPAGKQELADGLPSAVPVASG